MSKKYITDINLIVRHSNNGYSKVCNYLINDFGFQYLSSIENA